ncbi:chemotaxis protein CheU [Caulobacter sp. NIBR2454]|uniref:chemotaxis protein CheU n=1 Tax=Caulobacter sp. NIBR2454 TaxID=3015996 RepID=UPI0022B5EEA5|nr:chemotaxis protein CheU [Caulobacter sp. NIBR2454]
MSTSLRPAALLTPEDAGDLPVGELSRRLAAELAAAAAICRECEVLAGDLANDGVAIANLTRLQALDELTQRLAGLSCVLERISEHANGEWSLQLEPLLKGLGLADLVVRLRTANVEPAWDRQAGEPDLW